jgi:hypothetical protein
LIEAKLEQRSFHLGKLERYWLIFDWNTLLFDDINTLMVQFVKALNIWLGRLLSMPVILGMCYTDAYNTGYFPINDNHVWNNTGSRYNVSRAIDSRGIFDSKKYESYS